jgi:uncharacterized integral membrane protein
MHELVRKARLIVTVILSALLGIFAFQNVSQVELSFLIWNFHSRRIVVIAVSLLVGLAIGWLFGFSSGRRHPGRPRDSAEAGP